MESFVSTEDLVKNEAVKKQEAREQFDRVTKELNLKHTFAFDEVWDGMLKQRYRNTIMKFEDEMVSMPECLKGTDIEKVNPLKHSFADGCYVREIFNPKGEIIVTKIHKISHPYFLLKGDMSIMTAEGPKRIKAPHYGITPAGTKRIIYTHEDCVFVTVHVTDKTDLAEIEDEVIAKDFNEVDNIDLIDVKTNMLEKE